jgi:hypothetical protein
LTNFPTLRAALLTALLSIASIVGFAKTINLSASTGLTNDGSGTTYAIVPDPAWAPALIAPDGSASSWVSDVPTTTKNVPVGSTVDFTDTFTLTGSPSGYWGWVTVLADDSASVTLNGHLLQPVNLIQGDICSNGPIGCLPSTELTITFLAADLVAGPNQLVFGVRQSQANSPYGLNFAGVVSDTPEPATFGVFGLGLIALSLVVQCSRVLAKG